MRKSVVLLSTVMIVAAMFALGCKTKVSDDKGEVKIEITGEGASVEVESADGTVEVSADGVDVQTGDASVEINAGGVSIEADGASVDISAAGVEADSDAEETPEEGTEAENE